MCVSSILNKHSAAAAAAAAAKSLQSCPTLCDLIDGSIERTILPAPMKTPARL